MSAISSSDIKDRFATFKPHFADPKTHMKNAFRSLIGETYADKDIRVLDIGGGKFPLFPKEAIPSTWDYTVNDISETELAQLPPGYRTMHADICGDLTPHHGQFDLLFSCMLAEHIKDSEAFYRNQFALLRPGGMAIHLHPSLFSLPFLVNWIVPHSVGKKIVETLQPRRKQNRSVFPAFYDWCTARPREIERRKSVGFEHVDVAINYYHSYLRSIPVINKMSDGMCRLFAATDTRTMASFCVYMAVKGESS